MQTESLIYIPLQKYGANRKADIYLEIQWSLALIHLRETVAVSKI